MSALSVSESIANALSALRRGPRVQRLHRLVMERAGVDLDRPALTALTVLATSGPLRVSELAEVCAVDISTMSRLAGRMTCSGFVVQSTDPNDGRVVMLELTDDGREATQRMVDAKTALIGEVIADWSADDRAAFAALLDRFVIDLERTNRLAIERERDTTGVSR
ncbi:MAG TPA: MarR family transcriptional regulator [Thermomicrobiales bacterium]|nr:MarR family transcriptional regulator [Thermomicrobiales bacterium]